VVKKYRVLFHGVIQDDEAFKTRMKCMGVPSETLERMMRNAPVILKGGLTLGAARNYADAVQEAGGRVTIQEYGFFKESARTSSSQSIASLEDFTMCLQCGLKQPKGKSCIRCGFGLTND
jgi:hypothetical protein